MANRSIELSDPVHDYLLKASLREVPALKELREATAKIPLSIMQIAPEQGQFMRLLVQILGARHCLEVGTFTGYSTLSVALGSSARGSYHHLRHHRRVQPLSPGVLEKGRSRGKDRSAYCAGPRDIGYAAAGGRRGQLRLRPLSMRTRKTTLPTTNAV